MIEVNHERTPVTVEPIKIPYVSTKLVRVGLFGINPSLQLKENLILSWQPSDHVAATHKNSMRLATGNHVDVNVALAFDCESVGP